jgi:hypothetical protein
VAEHLWLDPVAGDTHTIGTDFFERLAKRTGLAVDEHSEPRGLIDDFDSLAGPECAPEKVDPAVVRFYEHTSRFDFDVWSEWCGAFRPFGFLLSAIFSSRLQQLNVPLSSLDAKLGTTSRVLKLRDEQGRSVRTAWVRELIATRRTLYAGSYAVCNVPRQQGPCVRVVFPLPNGNAHVILKPEVYDDGSLKVTSSGQGFGDAGFYFFVAGRDGEAWVRYVKTLRESIHVFVDEAGALRADHVMSIWGLVFLRLHYRLRLRDVIE